MPGIEDMERGTRTYPLWGKEWSLGQILQLFATGLITKFEARKALGDRKALGLKGRGVEHGDG